ncbi:acyl-CoA synthetase short-chain family member 3, mitochondrial [Musca domestica]|uniref:Acyl-CoA synthetase short-chain family member 3, mitochondrial n=1 Tax=Musca domestica TaxID=7370 RepID=A0A9J7HZH2_MUSDO|nr:acyl-CoA synthetase short-chain family member 3, mitochondrial [Musca domestica]
MATNADNDNYNGGLPDDSHDPLYLECYRKSINQPGDFWDKVGHLIDWMRPWNRVLDNSNPPFTKWFVGGYLNACYNAVDRHVLQGKGDKVALIHDSPLTNTVRHVTYGELYEQVSLLAGGMSSLGVERGDKVVIYMPLIPEAIVAMLATARLGAVHSVVFGGFAASELCTRIEHAKPKIIIAANCGIEPGKIIPYLDILHKAVEMSKWKPSCNVVFERSNIARCCLNTTTDIPWISVMTLRTAIDCVPVEANDPLYILYTSGTTDKPKGVQRPIGGHLVTLMYTMKTIYGINPDDVWWNASDLGWVVGHSYICYGPLLYGATSVMYEGKPDRTPDPGQYYRLIDQHKVTSLFSVPTSFRVLRRVDPDCKYGRKYSLKSLRSIFVAGEHCDLETKSWIEKTFKVPVLNNWWQTETGSAITATCLGFNQRLDTPAFTTGLPFIGYNIKVVHADGTECEPLELGRIVIKLPLPPGNMSTLYENDELFKKLYFTKYPGYYDTMDAGYKDENGYIFVTARADDIINVAGHRISTLALEDAVLRHSDVVDVAVFGVPEPTKGQVPMCLYVPREGCRKTPFKLSAEIIQKIREIVGPIASFRLVAPVKALPRTRSGKTMRKAMADFAKNELVVLPATIEDPSVFIDIRRAMQCLGHAMNTPEPVVAVNKK